MRFWEAMKALDEEKKVRRPHWKAYTYLSIWKHGLCLETKEPNSLLRVIKYEFSDAELLCIDWELYDDTPKLNFMQVVEGLKNGKKFKRIQWKEGIFIHQNRGLGYIMFGQYIDPLPIFRWQIQDFEATDWIEVK